MRLVRLSVEAVCEVAEGVSDIIRQMLSWFDKVSFELCQQIANDSRVFLNLHGLSTLGGPKRMELRIH